MSKLHSKELTEIQPSKVIFWGLVDWTVIAATLVGFAHFPNVGTFFLAALIIGNRQHALGIIAHEGAHYLVSRNKRINDLITNMLVFWPLGGAVSGYRGFHLAHHRNYLTANDIEREAIHRDMGSYFSGPLRLRKVFRVMVADALGLNAATTFRMFKLFNEYLKKTDLIIPTSLQLAYWVVGIASGYWYLPAVWTFSMFSGYLMTFRIRIWLEHIGIHETHRTALPRWFAAVFAPHNTSHHWEHHRHPGVPFYNLPAMRKADTSVKLITLRELIRFHRNHSIRTDHWQKPEAWQGYQSREAAEGAVEPVLLKSA
jgi:fatty acid desaturase